MRRLYDDYRGKRYVHVRRQCEPGYSNELATGDVVLRRLALDEFLARHLGNGSSETVLDFGGDDGRFIPPFFRGRRLVYDISGRPLAPGVERLRDLTDVATFTPQYVLLSHILEHLPQPEDVLKSVAGLMAQQGLLYVEVPREGQRLRWLGPPRFYRRAFNYLINQRFADPMASFLIRCFQPRISQQSASSPTSSRLLPRRLDRIKRMLPPMEDLRLHEHINFFTAKSLELLLLRVGFEPKVIEPDGGVWRVLAALRPRST